MIIDVHVHYRNDAQLAQALRQAERLDMVLCSNSINLKGTTAENERIVIDNAQRLFYRQRERDSAVS